MKIIRIPQNYPAQYETKSGDAFDIQMKIKYRIVYLGKTTGKKKGDGEKGGPKARTN